MTRQQGPRPDCLVVHAATEEVLSATSDPASLLNRHERSRLERFRRSADARDFLAGHVLLRLGAAAWLGRRSHDVDVEQICERCGGPHGRPTLVAVPDARVSLAHTRGHVAAAVGAGTVGVDVEARRPASSLANLPGVYNDAELLLAASATDPELGLLRLWTRKEALVKAGRGELDHLRALDCSEAPLSTDAAASVSKGSLHGLHLLEWLGPHCAGCVVSADLPVLHSWRELITSGVAATSD